MKKIVAVFRDHRPFSDQSKNPEPQTMTFFARLQDGKLTGDRVFGISKENNDKHRNFEFPFLLHNRGDQGIIKWGLMRDTEVLSGLNIFDKHITVGTVIQRDDDYVPTGKNSVWDYEITHIEDFNGAV